MSIRAIAFRAAVIATAFTMVGCNAGSTKETASMGNEDIYEVVHDGRYNVFYDRKTYEEFMSLGETSFRLTRIGAGPKGETVVFGLTKNDKKKGAATPAAMMWDGQLKPAKNFYGELRHHGRIYVFSNFEDMKPVRDFGHPNFFYTEIGAGPKGETVVYVLNSKTKKKKPEALIAKFKAANS